LPHLVAVAAVAVDEAAVLEPVEPVEPVEQFRQRQVLPLAVVLPKVEAVVVPAAEAEVVGQLQRRQLQKICSAPNRTSFM
jgi:hypothetical protein